MNPPDEVFLKRAAECELMAKFTRDPESKFTWSEWQRDGIGARRWPRAPARWLRTTTASPINTGNPPPVGHTIRGSEQKALVFTILPTADVAG
jgi:hypothetical protein